MQIRPKLLRNNTIWASLQSFAMKLGLSAQRLPQNPARGEMCITGGEAQRNRRIRFADFAVKNTQGR
ncbi:MAG: hypothetical protein LBU34_05285 [Planctomycetaceae bacterium]|jgi:hypothetical protein|nr:hypothetical protein [Planctomycetaceae bacterium]